MCPNIYLFFHFPFIASQSPCRENAPRPNQQQHWAVKDDFLSHHADTRRAGCQTGESRHFRDGRDVAEAESVFTCKFKFCTWLLSVFARDAAPRVLTRSSATQRPGSNHAFLCPAEDEPEAGFDVTKSQLSCSQSPEKNSIQKPSGTVETMEEKLTACIVLLPIYHHLFLNMFLFFVFFLHIIAI